MNKKKLLTPLFVLASFALIGCSADEIVARPSWVDDPIIDNVGEKDNKMKEIYDAIKELGETNSYILDKVLSDVATKNIGPLWDVTTKDGKTHLGLKTIAGNPTDEQYKEFLSEHPIYEAGTEGVKNGEKVTLDENDKKEISLSMIKEQYKAIIEAISEKMFNEVKGGSYQTQTTKLYREQYFVEHLEKDLYNVGDYNPEQLVKDVMFFSKPEGMTWEEFVNNKYLHLFDTKGELTTLYKDYVTRKIIPAIYRSLLVETYVREQRYTNLGRSYARKVNMVTVPNNSSYSLEIKDMLYYYAQTYITGTKTSPIDPDYNFELLNEALIGFAGMHQGGSVYKDKVYELLNYTIEDHSATAHNFPNVKVKGLTKDVPFIWKARTNEKGESASESIDYDTYVYQGTKLGDLVTKYLKMYDVTATTDTPTKSTEYTFKMKKVFDSEAQSAYNDITNNGAYPIELGLELKEREIRSADITKDGWFLKNGGLTELNETYREHLFNIDTANIIDSPKDFEQGDYVRYIGKTEGKKEAFLVDSITDVDKPWEAVVLTKEDSSNFYIVEVREAISTSKMSTNINNENSYLYKKSDAKASTSTIEMDKIVREVVKASAVGDTYKNNAEQYYLMISNVLFYDQSVYDYFKSQFPDLFK